MKYDWLLVRNAFLSGLLMTASGVFLVIYTGWNEATIICLGLGPLFLFSSLMLAFFYRWMARVGALRLPEDWDKLSPEAKCDLTEKQAIENNKRFALGLMRLNDAQRRNAKEPAERDRDR